MVWGDKMTNGDCPPRNYIGVETPPRLVEEQLPATDSWIHEGVPLF